MSRTHDMHAAEKSDEIIVPLKSANNAVETAAEPMEARVAVKTMVIC